MPILVSDSAAEESLQAYTSPLSLQTKALDDLSEKVLNGDVVADGNNPFTFLTEFASNMTAGIVNKACECFNSLYPENAQTSSELYKHLSDFGYVGMFATPATTTVELVFDRNFLIDHAVTSEPDDTDLNQDVTRVSGQYSKVVIPAYSKFTVGDMSFGMMYPIEIHIRKAFKNGDINDEIDYNNSVITVLWDTTYQNPLMPLKGSILQHRDFIQDGMMLTAIEVPIYQFEVENHTENAIASTGFAKRYDYHNKFYAIRVFHFKNGYWQELNQTFSDTNYDVDIPTAIIKVLQDLGKVEVVIPHIYFNSPDTVTVIGNRILVKIYTTLGEVSVDLSDFQIDQFQASFLLSDTSLMEDDRYSNMLKRIPNVYIIPLSNRIASGTNGITFNELKNRVKYNNSFTVKITPSDLENYFATSGYSFTKPLDNITDRVYCAHKIITDGTGTPVASGMGQSIISTSMTNDEEYSDSIVRLDDDTFTILPSALYLYDDEKHEFNICTNTQKSELLRDSEIVDTFNNNLYTYSPFHVVVSNARRKPIAGTYDLFNPSLRSIMLDWENERITTSASIYNATIHPINEGDKTVGYRLRVAIFKTADITFPSVEEDNQNIRVLLTVETDDGRLAHLFGTYAGTNDTGHDVFDFDLLSTFRIKPEGSIHVSTLQHELGKNFDVFVPIKEHKYTISFFLADEKIPDENERANSKNNVNRFSLPDSLEKYTMLCRQYFTLKLGESIPLLQNNITISTTEEAYKTYNSMQFATYQSPIYARYTIADVENNSATIEQIGMLKVDDAGKPVIGHDVDEVIINHYADLDFGAVLSIKLTENKIVDGKTTKTSYDEELGLVAFNKPYSTPNDIWKAIDGDLYVLCESVPEFSGIYILENTGGDTERVWKQSYRVVKEIFDESILHLNKVVYKITVPNEHGLDPYHYTVEEPNTNDVFDRVIDPDTEENCFYSCNSDTVKSLIPAKPLKDINTSATGYDRKWFFISKYPNDPNSFDFDSYTGLVIEYAPSETVDFGNKEGWVLNRYYLGKDVTTGAKEIDFENILEDIDSDTDALSEEECAIFENDTYRKGIDVINHYIFYEKGPNNFFEETDEEGNPYQNSIVMTTAVSDNNGNLIWNKNDVRFYGSYYLGKEDSSGNPIFMPRIDPWKIDWKPVRAKENAPLVTKLHNSNLQHELRITGALEFMTEQAKPLGCKDAPVLHRSLEDYIPTLDEEAQEGKKYYMRVGKAEYTECDFVIGVYEECDVLSDPLEGKQFVVATNIKTIPTPKANEGMELGNTFALYRRNYEASTLQIKNLSKEELYDICREWSESEGQADSVRYAGIMSRHNVSLSELEKIVSDTKPCYYRPWEKIVTCDSIQKLEELDNQYAGYAAILYYKDDDNNDVIHYYNILSSITRTYETESGNKYKRTELVVNPTTSSWAEIDKWPWEYTTPWYCLTPTLADDIAGNIRSDLKISFNSDLSGAKILHDVTDTIIDEEGFPVLDEAREIVYGIDMIHCDYKLRLVEDAEYANYLNDIRDVLRAYLNELKAITPSLLARTKLYYAPICTFGTAKFRGSSGETRVLPVQFSMEYGLHIASYVSSGIVKKDVIRGEIIKFIKKALASGSINMASIAKTIMKELGDEIVCVDVLGINGDKTLQTMIPLEKDCYPQLRQILVQYEDGSIHVDHDLTVDWYVLTE